MNKNDIAVIMAGGSSTLLKSAFSPVLAKVLGRPMISSVTEAALLAGIEKFAVIVPSGDTQIRALIKKDFPEADIEFFEQTSPLGTANAVLTAEKAIEEAVGGNVLILNGDTPFIDASTINSAYIQHIEMNNSATVITATVSKPFGYGRIIRDENEHLAGIVEESDADSITKKITEISSGTYWFKANVLLPALKNLSPRANGHFNLVDVISDVIKSEMRADTYFAPNSDIILGANDRLQLMELNEYAKMQSIQYHLAAGVEIPYPDGIVIEKGVTIGTDTCILPGTIIKGNTQIGKNCVIGPNSVIEDSVIGDNVKLNQTQCEQCVVKSGANIGPFVHIRPNSVIGDSVHLGNFVEVKNSNIDTGTKVSHLTYVGDSDVGKRVNFGCGTVTVNYSGKAKYRTTIGDDVFIGCNTNLVAPVTVGDGAYTAAGSTITEDVPADSLGIARARQVNKIGWKVKK